MEVLTGKPESLPLLLWAQIPWGAKRETEAWEKKSGRVRAETHSPFPLGGVLNRLLASCCALLDGMQGRHRHVALGDLAAMEENKGRRGEGVASLLS